MGVTPGTSKPWPQVFVVSLTDHETFFPAKTFMKLLEKGGLLALTNKLRLDNLLAHQLQLVI